MISQDLFLAACFIILAGLHPFEAGLHPPMNVPLDKSSPNSSNVSMGSRPLIKYPLQGGRGNGTLFDDFLVDFGTERISGIWSINISASDKVDSIQVTYILTNHTYHGPVRGSVSSEPFTIELGNWGHLDRIEGVTDGVRITQLTVTTRVGRYEKRVYGPFWIRWWRFLSL